MRLFGIGSKRKIVSVNADSMRKLTNTLKGMLTNAASNNKVHNLLNGIPQDTKQLQIQVHESTDEDSIYALYWQGDIAEYRPVFEVHLSAKNQVIHVHYGSLGKDADYSFSDFDNISNILFNYLKNWKRWK